MGQITTYILDTSIGKPAAGITVILYNGQNDEWTELGREYSAADGNAGNLLKKSVPLPPGIYKLRFEVKDYFDQRSIPCFYPYIEIIFDLTTQEHYHIPLQLSPFGYSTYRSS